MQSAQAQPVVLFLYFGLDCDGELSHSECSERANVGQEAPVLTMEREGESAVLVGGSATSLGQFSLRISVDRGTISAWGGAGVVLADVQQRVGSVLKKRAKKKGNRSPALPDKVQKGSNVVVVRVSCPSDCAVDTVLRPTVEESLETPNVGSSHPSVSIGGS